VCSSAVGLTLNALLITAIGNLQNSTEDERGVSACTGVLQQRAIPLMPGGDLVFPWRFSFPASCVLRHRFFCPDFEGDPHAASQKARARRGCTVHTKLVSRACSHVTLSCSLHRKTCRVLKRGSPSKPSLHLLRHCPCSGTQSVRAGRAARADVAGRWRAGGTSSSRDRRQR
jgi:hypothetical protein